MTDRSPIPRLMDIVDAINRIRAVTAQIDIARLEADWQRQWLLERGLEIISEASRHLPDDIKLRHPEIPWQRIAAVGNRLRHEYQRVLPDILWKIARDDLLPLERCLRHRNRTCAAQRTGSPVMRTAGSDA